MAAEKPSSKGQAWFCTTGLPSDIDIEVDDMTFHLHKFPLMSKSRKLHQLITEQEETETNANVSKQEHEKSVQDEMEEQQHCFITLSEFPGDSDTFETAAKFCYGIKIELSSSNVAPLRCAAEVLEMTEEYSEDNLISKTEMFLSQSVLKSLKDSIRTLKSCDRDRLMPLAETLDITQRCIDSIAIRLRASSVDPSLLGWPVSGGAAADSRLSNQILWNGIEIGLRKKGTGNDSWLEDISLLGLPLFERLILAMRAKDLNPGIIESCLICYANRHIPGISRSNRKPSSSSSYIPTEIEQRQLLETIVSNLPLEKTSRSSNIVTRFLFRLLRTANILNALEASRASLEKKIGLVLEEATLDDLLIPSYSYLNETLYDVYCVERILGYFLESLEEEYTTQSEVEGEDYVDRLPALVRVGKLIDGYLSEIASDANLKPDKLYELAVALPDQARLFDDGLYRAVDVYLKAHPWISEAEREKISGMMNCQKLTLEACTHAAQNERLPLRAIVQVLFFEQLQLRHAISGTVMTSDILPTESGRPSILRREQQQEEADDDGVVGVWVPNNAQDSGSTWRENQVLRLDMDSMRSRVHQLERECSTMKKVIEKIDKTGPPGVVSGWRGSLTKKFGCKFKTLVCDSHESTVVKSRKGKDRYKHHQQ